MTLHSERMTAAVLDMWYGRRQDWFDDDLPYDMNVQINEPAYRDHTARSQFGTQPDGVMDWVASDRERIALGVSL